MRKHKRKINNMNKKNIMASLMSTLIATIIYGLIISIFKKGNLDVVDFVGFGVYAITMFITNIFIIQKYRKSEGE